MHRQSVPQLEGRNQESLLPRQLHDSGSAIKTYSIASACRERSKQKQLMNEPQWIFLDFFLSQSISSEKCTIHQEHVSYETLVFSQIRAWHIVYCSLFTEYGGCAGGSTAAILHDLHPTSPIDTVIPEQMTAHRVVCCFREREMIELRHRIQGYVGV